MPCLIIAAWDFVVQSFPEYVGRPLCVVSLQDIFPCVSRTDLRMSNYCLRAPKGFHANANVVVPPLSSHAIEGCLKTWGTEILEFCTAGHRLCRHRVGHLL
jgi:hypothetical protein